jgi:hypothetical protein
VRERGSRGEHHDAYGQPERAGQLREAPVHGASTSVALLVMRS